MKIPIISEFEKIRLDNYIFLEKSNGEVGFVIRDLENFRSIACNVVTIYCFAIFSKNSKLLEFYKIGILVNYLGG